MSKNRILVVEEHADARMLLALVLARSGYEVFEAASGNEAIQIAGSVRPGLIITELGLPDIPGDEVIARLTADSSNRKPAVVVNTAFHEGAVQVQRAIAAGAALILHKPTSLKTFQTIALRYLSSSRADGSARGIRAETGLS